ncbi:MAG: ERAP1-like C-terminal domain-containing protein, partial [Silvibacterium sp.]|nr:ERAP1-like C-terminal domain-containing protein [Silvibacterium sp.]
KPEGQETWSVPVCFKAAERGENCELLSEAQQSLKTPAAPFFFGNAEGKGYYRTKYPGDIYAKIVANVETGLTPEERIILIGDEWAQVRANKAGVGDIMNLAAAVKGDASGTVLDTALAAVNAVYTRIAATQEERDAISAWVRATFKPSLERLGAPAPDDSPEKRQLRAALFGALGNVGKDPEVIAQAKELATKYLADQRSVDPTLAETAMAIAAINGDAALYDQLKKQAETATNPELQEGSLRLLAEFKDASLEKRSLDYTVSGKVRNQDSLIELVIMLAGTDTRDLAWNFIRENWDKVQAQLTTSMGGFLVSGTGAFCSAEKRDEVVNFFTTHKVPASERALTRAKDQINECIELRSLQEPNLKAWIASQK